MKVVGLLVCDRCGRESEQLVEVGTLYTLRCPCVHPELTEVVLVEQAAGAVAGR